MTFYDGDYIQNELRLRNMAPQQTRAEAEENLRTFVEKKLQRLLDDRRDSVNETRKKLEEQATKSDAEAFAKMQYALKRREGRVAETETVLSKVPEEVHEESLAISKVPRVLGYDCDATLRKMTIYTDTLFGYDRIHERAWFRLGSFRIEILLDRSGDITWFRNKGVVACSKEQWNERIHAPLIAESGRTRAGCIGTLEKPLRCALSEFRFADAVTMVVRFVECSGGYGYRPFPKVEKGEVPKWYLANFPD